MSLLNVSGITKKEGEDYLLKNINFIQEPCQKIAIAGATGSGKSTLLKIIAGLIQPDAGEVLFEGTRVKGPLEKLLPGHPQVAYLSQHFELRNNYRVEEVLEIAGKIPVPDARMVYEVCRIDHLLTRWTDELSGGERQRVAFAKALVTSPKLLLLDEPFSNLDAIHRSVLKQVIADIETQLNTSCLLVSHDPVDLLSWADEILVLKAGRIVQKSSPEEIYKLPSNEYVAGLFGKYNLLSEELKEIFSYTGNKRFFRPEEFRTDNHNENGVKGRVYRLRFMGSYYEMEILVQETSLLVYSSQPFDEGNEVIVSLSIE